MIMTMSMNTNASLQYKPDWEYKYKNISKKVRMSLTLAELCCTTVFYFRPPYSIITTLSIIPIWYN